MTKWHYNAKDQQIYSDDFANDVALKVYGDFETSDQQTAYAEKLVALLNAGGEAAQEEKYDRARWDIGPDGYSVTVYFPSEKPMFEFYQKIASPPE